MSDVVGRFAPTPSGYVHIGNAFCYLLAWLSAKKQGGRIVLRMDDVDMPRVVSGISQQTLDDLHWLGLDWDEGPKTGSPEPGFFQSERRTIYEQHFSNLLQRDLVYPCFCSRADLKLASAPHAEDGHSIYPGTCSHLTEAQRTRMMQLRPPAWRVRVPDAEIGFVDPNYGAFRMSMQRDCGDFPIRRADGIYCYQFVTAIDDALMGINEVVRSNDLLSSTPQQIYLQRLFDYPQPHYIHIPMILDCSGNRMAKRNHALSIKSVRDRFIPEEVLGRLAFLAGQKPNWEPCTLAELLDIFSWDLVPKENIILPDFF